MRLLIDEDTQAHLLVDLLRQAGHSVIMVDAAGLASEPDDRVLDFARRESRVTLTQNCFDFRALHHLNPQHPGILCIFHDKNSRKDMVFAEIVRAVGNIESSGFPIAGEFVALNTWNY